MLKLLMPNTLATNLSNLVIAENPQFKKSKNKIRYGLEWIISGLNQIVIVCLLVWPFGILPETLVALLTGALLRMFSGGSHFTRYYFCLVFSTIQIISLTIICVKYTDFLSSHNKLLLLFLLLSFLITMVKAPVLHKKKHIFNKDSILRLKITAITIYVIFAGVSLFFPYSIMYCIWLPLIFQSITLTVLWEKIVLSTEYFINKITSKGPDLL